MINNATYTDILAEIREFFAQHLLVNSFIDGQLYDFQAKDNVYSAVVLVPTPSQIQNTQLNLALDLYFVDRINEDGSNTRDVYNDELQIVQDFISYFTNRPNAWNLSPENINIEPFEQKFVDILAGWRLSVQVLLPFRKNVCEIPLDDDRPEPPVPPVPPTPPTPYKKDHAQLRNLDYEHAGHTGFQKQLNSDNAGTGISIEIDPVTGEVVISNTKTSAEWGNIEGNIENQTDLTNALNSKQDTLTAGTNINIDSNNVISAVDTTYSQGTGITIDANDVISNDVSPLVPAQATVDNQLADKDFVNSSIATSTATFRGTYNVVTDLHLSTSATHQQVATALGNTISLADNNDYCFVEIPTDDLTPTETLQVDRYKYNGSSWSFEYTLNNSGYTSAQWKAINSGITSGKVTQYDGYATSKQDTLIAGTNITIDADGKTISSDIPQATSSVAGKVLLGAAGGAATYESVENRLPICYPTTASEIKTTSMLVKSSVSDNGKILTENGFVYNTSGNPTVSDTKVICDLGVGFFEKKLENLTINTEYHIKSYGQNASGLVYGSELVQRTLLSPIPVEYQLVEYLESSGTEYLIVSTSIDLSYNIKITFTPTTLNLNTKGIFGSRIGGVGTLSHNFFVTGTTNQVRYDYGTSSIFTNTYGLTECKIETNTIYGETNFNGLLYHFQPRIDTFNSPMLLFTSMQNGNMFDGLPMKVMYFEYGDKKLYPVYRIADNKPGMYDIVNGVFYTNQGTGEFTVGPDKDWE